VAQADCARVNRVALLFNPATAPYAEIYLGPFGAAAAALAVEAIAMSVGDTSELESAVGGFMVIPDPFMSNRRHRSLR
jgi:putative ABC transport system substrate-binding protein